MSILIPIFIAVVVFLLRQSAKIATKEQPKKFRTYKEKEPLIEPVLIKENKYEREQQSFTDPYQNVKRSIQAAPTVMVKTSSIPNRRKQQTRLMTDRGSLIQAFMLSEALGKPRATKPHPSMVRYRQKIK